MSSNDEALSVEIRQPNRVTVKQFTYKNPTAACESAAACITVVTIFSAAVTIP